MHPRLTVLACLCLAVAGCGVLERPPPREGPREPTVDEAKRGHEAETVSDLLIYYRRSGDMEPEAIRREIVDLRDRVGDNRCTLPRLRSAILVSRLPPEEQIDSADELLGPCIDDPYVRYTTEGGLALLLRTLLDARQTAARRGAEVDSLEGSVEGLRGEIEQLREQLEGLKAIERSIQQRDRNQGADEPNEQ